MVEFFSRNRDRIKRGLAYSYIGAVLVFLYAPIIAVIVFSFTESRIPGVWNGFSLGNYIGSDTTAGMFENPELMSAVVNTLVIALVSAVVSTFIGTLAAVGISNMRRVTKTVVSGVNQVPILNVDIITALSLMLLFVVVGIPSGYFTLIASHVLICTPFVVLSVMPRLAQLNPNLYEAALDLGAGPTKALFTVIIPQLVPGMIAGGLLAFTLSLDDFVITAYNNGASGIDTISTYLYGSLKKSVDPHFFALSTLIFLIVLGVLVAINIRARAKNKNKTGGTL